MTMRSVTHNRYQLRALPRPAGAARHGFTLVEIMIATAVMAVALFAAAGNLLSLSQAHAAQREDAAVQILANQIIERIMGATFAQLGQAIPANIQADQNAWSWQRRATPLPAAVAIAYGQVSAPGVALTAPINPPMGEYGFDPANPTDNPALPINPAYAMYATTDLVQLGLESQLSGISNLRVYLEYYSMNILNDMQAWQQAAVASPSSAMATMQRTSWMTEVGNVFLTDPTQIPIPIVPAPAAGAFPPLVTSNAPYISLPAYTAPPYSATTPACLPAPYSGTNIFFPESASGSNGMTQINLTQPAVPTTSQNDAVMVRVLIFWVSYAQGQRWHEVCVVRRN
jgi:prepilin-type N-terminal cleavage/methylation domain-containing protein